MCGRRQHLAGAGVGDEALALAVWDALAVVQPQQDNLFAQEARDVRKQLQLETDAHMQLGPRHAMSCMGPHHTRLQVEAQRPVPGLQQLD